MKFSRLKYEFPQTVTHAGNLFAFAAEQDADDPQRYHLGYTILDLDGAPEQDAWKDFKSLEFPRQLRPVGINLVTIDFKTGPIPVADQRFYVISDGAYIYVFRRSTANTLLVDRFVFDAALAVLTNAWEVRYRRSQNIDIPADRKDTFGSTNMDGKRFIEPTTELSMIGNLPLGGFAALILPTELSGHERWLILSLDSSSGKLDVWSIARSGNGLFDLTDAIDPVTHAVLPAAQLTLTQQGTALPFTSGPAPLLYSRQERLKDEYGKVRLLKKETRVMVAIAAGTGSQIAVADFGVGKDGRITQVTGALPVTDYPAVGTALHLQRAEMTAATLPQLAGAAASALTIECWIRPSELGTLADFVIVANQSETYNRVKPFSLALVGGAPVFTVASGGVSYAVTAQQLDPLFWYHLAGTWDGTRAILYVNGQPYTTSTSPPSSPPSPTSGYLLGGSSGASGDLKELRLWIMARSRAQILAAMDQPITSSDPDWGNLLGYWPLNAPPASAALATIPNSSALGEAANGSLAGAYWVPSSAPIPITMAPVAWDANGLNVTTALLTFAATDQTPSLLLSADGLVHMYFRDKASGAFFAAQFNTTTARAQYRTRWTAEDKQTPANTQTGTLRFLAKQPGSSMNNPAVSPQYVAIAADDQDPTLATVTLRHYTGLEEVWPKVPRALDPFLQVINGSAIQYTTDSAAKAEGYVIYDYTLVRVTPGSGYRGVKPGPGVGSGVFSVMTDGVPDNGMTALVRPTDGDDQPILARAGADCWWVSSPPGATLQFAQDGDSVLMLDEQQMGSYQGDLNVTGDLTVEAWINPSAISITDPDARILTFNHPDRKASYTLGIDDLGRPFAGTGDFAAVAQAYQIGLNRWTHLAAAYQTDYGVHLTGTKYLDAGDDESLSTSDAVTIEAWIKLDKTDTTQVIASMWDEAKALSWRLYVGSDNVPTFDVEQVVGTSTSRLTAKALGPVAASSWYHVAAIYDTAYKKEGAVQFQARDQSFVTIPQLTNPPKDAVSIELWLYLLTPPPFVPATTQTIIYTADAEQPVLFYLELNDRVLNFSVECGAFKKSITAASALPLEAWTHIAGTFDATGNIALYIDGLPATGLPLEAHEREAAARPLRAEVTSEDGKAVYSVGGFATNMPLNGWINELRIWNRALSLDEIHNNMHISLSGGERGLVGYWPFQDRFGETAMDLAGTANGTLRNAMYVQVQKGAFTHKVLLGRESHAGVRVENPINMGGSPLLVGTAMKQDFLQGTIDSIRLWKKGRMDWEVLHYMNRDVPSSSDGLVSKWEFETGHGRIGFDGKSDNSLVFRDARVELTDEVADSMWIPTTMLAGWTLYVNGAAVPTEPFQLPASYGKPQLQIGALNVGSAVGKFYKGLVNEIRVWNLLRTAAQITGNANRALNGADKGLVGYWPVSAGSGEIVADATGAGANGMWVGIDAPVWQLSTAPVDVEGPEVRLAVGGVFKPQQQTVLYTPLAGEYGAVLPAADGELLGVMSRAYMFVDPQQALDLDPGYAVGDLEVQFVGQVQTRPTIIGYIEGPPPVPSENLMLGSDSPSAYFGASSITLTIADEATQIFTASRDTGFDMSIDAKLGAQFESRTEAGVVVSTLLFGFISKIGVHTNFEHSLGWLNGATLTTTLNTSRISSVRLIGGWQKNQYKINGGEGNLYFPNNQGFALVNSGTADMYALRLKDTGALVSYTLIPNPDIPMDVNVIPFVIDPLYVKNGTLDGYIGFEHEKSYSHLAPGERGSYFKPLQAYALKQQIEREYQQLRATFDEFEAASIGRRTNVTQFTKGDIGAAATNLGSLLVGIKGSQSLSKDEWKAKVARRDLVNTYVWSADGGFYAEEEQFAAVREDSVGGSYDFKGVAGVYTEMGMSVGIHFELDSLFGGHIRTRSMKTMREGASFGMSVAANGERFINQMEIGQQNIPIAGKVRGYRFMSFYLAPSRRNFDEFSQIIDQNWLYGRGPYAGTNDPDAFALSQALTRPNEVWRVLHRVTYVNRVPAQAQEGESIGSDALKPSAEMNATNALLLAQLPVTATALGPVSVILTSVLAGLETNPLWGALLVAEYAKVRLDIMTYLRGYYEL